MWTPLNAALMILAAATLAAGCRGGGTVDTEPKADVLLLTPDYSVRENLGRAPVAISTADENLARLRVDHPEGGSVFLLVLFPDKLDATLPLPLSKLRISTRTEVSSVYFDRLLRAHRLILRGNLDEAERLIRRIEADYDAGYGTAVLSGNIALLRGDVRTARQQFDYAGGLLPEAAPAGSLVTAPPAAGGAP